MKRIVRDEGMADWLETKPGFEWDDGNSKKSYDKHGVDGAEVESLLEKPFVLIGRVVEPTFEEHRWVLFGQSRTGKLLVLVFTRRKSRLRPISCRPMKRKERRFYAEKIDE